MSIGEQVRRRGFWAWDRLSGGGVGRHAEDVARCWSDRAYCVEQGERRLRALLEHVTATVPYYRHLRGEERLDRFPVIGKGDMAAAYASFLSEGRGRRALRAVKTSGSYGVPMVFCHDREKQRRRLAEVVRCNELAGYSLGARHVLVRTKPKPFLRRLLQNEFVADASLVDGAWLGRLRAVLVRGKIRVLIGHATALAAIARYCLQQGDTPQRFGMRGVISYAEALHDLLREVIAEAFGCVVLDRYACEELGILAHEVPGRTGLHVNAASYMVEVLALDEDRPAAPGELGRVVVTDLWARAMPLIRYDTGDLAVLRGGERGALGGPVLERLEGRVVESVRTAAGTLLSPLAVVDALNDVLCADGGVWQYQFAQTGEGTYCVRIATAGARLPPGLAGRVATRVRDLLGPEAAVDVVEVDHIPALPSGKRPPVVNEWLASSFGEER